MSYSNEYKLYIIIKSHLFNTVPQSINHIAHSRLPQEYKNLKFKKQHFFKIRQQSIKNASSSRIWERNIIYIIRSKNLIHCSWKTHQFILKKGWGGKLKLTNRTKNRTLKSRILGSRWPACKILFRLCDSTLKRRSLGSRHQRLEWLNPW